jgi:hypothetical protein
MRTDQVRCVMSGAWMPPVARRCRPNSTPITPDASTRDGLRVAVVASTYTAVEAATGSRRPAAARVKRGRRGSDPPGKPGSHGDGVGGAVYVERFPVKQALEAVLGVSRTTFTSHMARFQFARLGFVALIGAGVGGQHRGSRRGVRHAGRVSTSRPVTKSIDRLERDLVDTDSSTAPAVPGAAGLSEELLEAALIVRRDVGRVSDVIHATVIALALPKILEPGEVISNRPSLGPGNDKSRPFDLETNRRVAEFKVALWSGGPVPPNKHQPRRRPADDFVTKHAAHIHVRNIADVLPTVSTALG